MQYFGWNSSEGMNKARNTAWCFFYFSEGVFYMQDVYCENCLFGLLGGGKIGWRSWVEKLNVETGWKDWVAKMGGETECRDRVGKLGGETKCRNRVEKPGIEDALVKYLFFLV